jgi:hypothetical protein
MTITKLSEEHFNELKEIHKKHKVLFLQNEGYEYIRKEFNDSEKKAKKNVEAILSKSILGFSSFTNFRLSKKTEELQLRFQYHYDADVNLDENKVRVGNKSESPFVGVGYITLRELHKGFD